MNRRPSKRWLTTPVLGWRDVGAGDIGFALLLVVFTVTSATGLTGSNVHNPNAGWGAAVLDVLLMTGPVVLARRSPLAVAAVLGVGAAVNWAVIGHLVRCGTGLPAAFYVAFMVGSRCPRWWQAGIGVVLVAGNVVCQGYSDPQLGAGHGSWLSVLGDSVVFMVPLTVAFALAGRLVASRNAAVARLRSRTAQLREQREVNARLAIAADQTRIAADLDGFLQAQVDQMARAAGEGRVRLSADPDQAQQAFVTIQHAGRATLTHMRDVVANLTDPAPTEPAPMLAQLDRLLAGATEGETGLRVTGDPRLLPPGLELTSYRIVEGLVVAIENDPAARIDVRVNFGLNDLELTVAGPTTRRGDDRPAIAAATERAAVHGGTLRSSISAGRRTTVVRLPMAAGHV